MDGAGIGDANIELVGGVRAGKLGGGPREGTVKLGAGGGVTFGMGRGALNPAAGVNDGAGIGEVKGEGAALGPVEGSIGTGRAGIAGGANTGGN
jgi:hypothetical protein